MPQTDDRAIQYRMAILALSSSATGLTIDELAEVVGRTGRADFRSRARANDIITRLSTMFPLIEDERDGMPVFMIQGRIG